jgi:hypothetical protein
MDTLTKSLSILAVLAVGLVATVAASAATVSGADKANAARACSALRTSSSAGFAAQYASFGACTSAWAHTAAKARTAAQATCRAKALTGKKFNACVKSTTAASLAPRVTTAKNAAKACQAERTLLGDTAFESKYGANGNLRNAFGKCVSGQASHKTPKPVPPATKTTHFDVALSALNSSGVSGSGSLLLNGNKLQVKLSVKGLEANQTHAIAIRGLAAGSATCPTASADTNVDGMISLGEGTTAFGSVMLGLDAASLAQSGWSTTVQASLSPLNTRTIVVLGKTVNGVYDATLPVACGTITSK